MMPVERTRRLAAVVGAAVTLAIATGAPGAAQQSPVQAPDPDIRLHFEVATVKPNKSSDQGGSIRRQPGGRLSAINMPLRQLITFAYQVTPLQLVGGHGWIG